MSELFVPEDRTALSCTQVRARLQSLCSEIAAVRYILCKAPAADVQADLLEALGQKCELLWTLATARLSHDELQTEDGQQELLIMDQCPIGRPF